ncbi:3-oxoacyl-(acyl carrier protein) synthase [Caballeronia hypogeia]|uniref:3-oxoacyl-(Acyl carrier protein) synthase n=1 Tax=Caballeronia hypogeia TaxID=1777140 RepID=A0A158BVD6_9BURK|nr:beta-ketoacyl synthase N-terminal-like domain-containing protein [Caballeronia hypogeia]SAK74035.1 3-oxoacyl-(acyl carrier protein) synthase [Caballeronia hypogeia]
MANPIHIAGVGARTPVGLQAASAAAAVRAGIAGLIEHPYMVDCTGAPMPCAPDAQIDPEIVGSERFILLAEGALREACEPLEDVRRQQLAIPLFLGLPEIRPGFPEQDALAIRSGVARFEGLPIRLSAVTAFIEGHASGLSALTAAVRQLNQGSFEMCLVGGVESYLNADTMEWLDENRQLAGTVSRSGFIPGEAAGFCLVMTDQCRRRLGLNSLAAVQACAIGKEAKLIKTQDICLGEGLSATVRNALDGVVLSGERITDIYCDINGERYRGEEWGFVCLRHSNYFDDPLDYVSPANLWGDVGAASAPLFMMLACQATARGYAKGPRTMLWVSSEKGLRAAAVLETEAAPKPKGYSR